MYDRFVNAKETYESKEMTLDELKILQGQLDITFENHGISRSKKDYLLCSIIYTPLLKLQQRLQQPFESETEFRQLMEQVLSGSEYEFKKEEGFISYETKDALVDVVVSLDVSGRVLVEPDDIMITGHFDVFLRVQH
ncbi:hypothetical protein PGH07_01470 [Sulfurovum sp. zt1-1]|uniref:Uncharacterized protein n=1 Tax=Sulfurovum zhangzhouensis TaxID=3019067 RepID=A0ABT7QVH0_9BACT|nr:hypothetical protein [Sulfurovum zhangzhouensis]MDM5270842.1 hypothetical protein [Sulfurovum zhangzhouensis]